MSTMDRCADVGEPVEVVTVGKGKHFEVNTRALEALLLDERVKNKPICVVSIVGAFRKGKSFMLDFFLRYLLQEGRSDWLKQGGNTLTGFKWGGGRKRVTTGIWVWSRAFLCRRRNGEEVAVILMDTQGTFDLKSDIKECTSVFAFSTLMSSLQILNVMKEVQRDDLEHLDYFSGYGRLALEQRTGKTFQSLMILVRDWCYEHEFNFGLTGGDGYLEEVFCSESNHKSLKETRERILSCFESMKCFLMPSPGEVVSTDHTFNGRLSDIKDNFLRQLEKLTTLVLSGDHLVVKKIHDKPLTCEQYMQIFKVYTDIFKGDKLPSPKTVREANVEADRLVALIQANEAKIAKVLSDNENLEKEMNQRAVQEQQRAAKLKKEIEEQKLAKEQLEQQMKNQRNEENQHLLETLAALQEQMKKTNDQREKERQEWEEKRRDDQRTRDMMARKMEQLQREQENLEDELKKPFLVKLFRRIKSWFN